MPVANMPIPTRKYNNTGTVQWHWAPSEDTGSGIEGYFVDLTIGEGRVPVISEAWVTSPEFESSSLDEEGIYYLSVRAKNRAGTIGEHSEESDGVIVDTTAPEQPKLLKADPEVMTNVNSFTMTWENPDDLSGIGGLYYQFNSKPTSENDGNHIAGDDIEILTDLKVGSEGKTELFLWLEDRAGNSNVLHYSTVELNYDGTAPPEPLAISVDPDGWSSINSFEIDWTVPEDLSGVKAGSYYYLGTQPPEKQSDGIWTSTKPFTVTNLKDTETDLYLWLEDNVGNCNYSNYKKTVLKFDNIKPVLKHAPVTDAVIGSEIEIEVEVWDNESGIDSVMIYYRLSTDESYSEEIMVKNGDHYYFKFKPEQTTGGKIEYYIKVTDKAVPGNVNYFGASGKTGSDPDLSTDIDIVLTTSDGEVVDDPEDDTKDPTKGDPSKDSAKDQKGSSAIVYGGASLAIIGIMLVIIFLFNIRKRQRASQTTSDVESSVSEHEVLEGKGAEERIAEAELNAVPVPAAAVPEAVQETVSPLPASEETQLSCPECKNILTEENRCSSCAWTRQL
jgi:hypothetical protein